MRSDSYPEVKVLDSSLARLFFVFYMNAPFVIQRLPSPRWKYGGGSVTPCNIFSSRIISEAFEGMEVDSRQMGPLTSMSPCGAPVTTELFCHLCCHQIKADPGSTKKSNSCDS